MSQNSAHKRTSEIVRDLVDTDGIYCTKDITSAWFPTYPLMARDVLRQKREEKYKGLQHD